MSTELINNNIIVISRTLDINILKSINLQFLNQLLVIDEIQEIHWILIYILNVINLK